MVGPKPVKPLTAKSNLASSGVEKKSAKPKIKKVKEAKTATNPSDEPKPVDHTSAAVSIENKIAEKNELVKLELKQIEEGVRAFSKLMELEGGDKKDLFASDGQKVTLQISGIRLPRDSEAQVLKCRLPHCPLPPTRDVCLFVKDMEKGIKADHEDTVRHYTSLLEEKGVKGITQVIALRELKVEYKQYEAKNQLVHRFDKFLADDRIIRLLPPLLGKAFYKRKKLPLQVNLKANNLANEIGKMVNTVTLPLQNSGSCSQVTAGLTTMGQGQLVENVSKLVGMIEERYPGGWKNVRSIHVRCGPISLPLYVSLRATQDVGLVHGAKKPGKAVVIDELSTVVGGTVIVTPGGGVRVKRKRDPEWPEDGDMETPVDSEEGDKENNVEPQETSEPSDSTAKRPKKNEKSVDDDSEDEMEDKELEYMQKVAEEEEEIEANEEKQMNKLQTNEEDEDQLEEDEDEIEKLDDDAEAENLLSDGDVSDSDDELIMKTASTFNDMESEDEEEKKTLKKKKKKVKKPQVDKKSPAVSKKTTKQKKFIEKKKKEKFKSKK